MLDLQRTIHHNQVFLNDEQLLFNNKMINNLLSFFLS